MSVAEGQQAERIDALLKGVRVMPVVVIEDAAHAVPMMEALLEGGVTAAEVTLRTDAALAAVEAIAKALPEVTIGTGTVLTEGDLQRSEEAGARFAVSPGLTPTLAEAAAKRLATCPLLPGTATASEVMAAMEMGFTRLKFFPAENVGGAPALKGLGGPLPQAKFCPTGGIGADDAQRYLDLPNTFCVGGSWVTPKAAMKSGDWAEITRLAKISRG